MTHGIEKMINKPDTNTADILRTATVEVIETENGELALPMDSEIMSSLGWKTGDTIVWTKRDDGSFSLARKETELVLVETISTFRIRHVVEVPRGCAEWALDTVTMDEAEEFSQQFLTNTIVSHRVITEDEALVEFDRDNDYLSGWTREAKLANGITRWSSISADTDTDTAIVDVK